MRHRASLAWLIVPLACLFGSAVIDGAPSVSPSPVKFGSAAFRANDACTAERLRLPGGRLLADTRVVLGSNGIARGRVCEPGRLTAVIEPAPTGTTAHVVVSWRGSTLWEAHLDAAHRIDVELPGAGWVAIASVTVTTGTQDDFEGSGLWISELAAEPYR